MVAITNPKIARTTVSDKNRMARNSTRARGLIKRPAISPTVWPRFRSDTTNAPKSCTAPIKIEPKNTQIRAGSQPQKTATAGPTIGPVPAMLVKWCPKMT